MSALALVLLVVRLLFVAVVVAFATSAFGYLLLFYERSAADAALGIRRPMSRERLRAGIGAWAREAGLHLVMAWFWLSGVLPRPKLRTGAWLPLAREQRPGRPVLLVPGYAMNRGTLRTLERRIQDTGRRVLAISLPWGKTIEELAALVGEAASELQRATGEAKIDVVCHSRGGVVTRWWIQMMGGHESVERFVSLGSGFKGTKMAAFGIGPSILQQFPGSDVLRAMAEKPLPADVEWYAVNGADDCMILPPGNDELPAPGKNVRLDGVGHTALLLSSDSWRAIHAAIRRNEAEGFEADVGDDETADEAALRTLAELSR